MFSSSGAVSGSIFVYLINTGLKYEHVKIQHFRQHLASFLNSSVLTSYLTNGLTSLERFPISFKTQFSGHCFHHVVLGVYCNGRYGSLGMSRRQDLMDKPLTHRTLGELVAEFESSYKTYQHTLKKVREGINDEALRWVTEVGKCY